MSRRCIFGLVALLACHPTTPAPPPAVAVVTGTAPQVQPEPTAEPDPKGNPERAPAPAAPAAPTKPDDWLAQAPWIADPALEHPEAQASEAGDVRVRWWVLTAELEALGPRLVTALAELGHVASGPCDLRGGGPCRFRSDDRLAVLSTHTSYAGAERAAVTLHLLPAGHRPLARLPGPCVVPPTREGTILVSASGFDQQGEFRQGQLEWALRTHAGPDLDGDGEPERYVPHAAKGRCPWDVPHDVYVMRGDCGHRVGTIVGPVAEETSLARFVGGLRVITTVAEHSAYDGDFPEPNHHTRTRRYELRGGKLREVADEHRAGKCHHCAVEHCRPLPSP